MLHKLPFSSQCAALCCQMLFCKKWVFFCSLFGCRQPYAVCHNRFCSPSTRCGFCQWGREGGREGPDKRGGRGRGRDEGTGGHWVHWVCACLFVCVFECVWGTQSAVSSELCCFKQERDFVLTYVAIVVIATQWVGSIGKWYLILLLMCSCLCGLKLFLNCLEIIVIIPYMAAVECFCDTCSIFEDRLFVSYLIKFWMQDWILTNNAWYLQLWALMELGSFFNLPDKKNVGRLV